MIKIQDIYWLAGLIEGEGWFEGPKGRLLVGLGMTDLDTIEKASKLLGSKSIGKRDRTSKNQKDLYKCTISGGRAAQWMMTIYPIMSLRRQHKIQELLTIWKTRPVPRRSKYYKRDY